MKIVINGGDINEQIVAALDEFFVTELGPAIEADAVRYAPKRTGHLAESMGHHLEDHNLIVDNTADYAVYVEMGHRVAHGPGMREVGPKVVSPQPFLRAALYTERGL